MNEGDEMRVMPVFEAGARLRIPSETQCLAAHLFHRFYYHTNQTFESCESYTVAAACLKLASMFYNQTIDSSDLSLVMSAIIRPKGNFYLDRATEMKYQRSIDLTMQIVLVNVRFEVNYKNMRRIPPGELAKRARAKVERETRMTPEEIRLEEERGLTRNNRDIISGQRWLAHYLKSIMYFVGGSGMPYFKKMANIAWTLLNDCHWTTGVIQNNQSHLACCCLIMAIEILEPALNCSKEDKEPFWKFIDKKWNLILCDDFDDIRLGRMKSDVINYYKEFDRAIQNQFKTYVIG